MIRPLSEDQETLAAAVASGAATVEEQRQAVALSRQDESFRALLADLALVQESLVREVVQLRPSPELRNRLLQAVSASQSQTSPAASRVQREAQPANILSFPMVPWLRTALPWAAAAALTIALVWQQRQVGALSAQLECLRAEAATDQWIATTLHTVSDRFTSAQATVLWNNARKEGKLTVVNLPPCAKGNDYQLWIICPKSPHPIDAGVVRVDANGRAEVSFRPSHPLVRPMQFAISAETAGGCDGESGPEGPILLAGSVL